VSRWLPRTLFARLVLVLLAGLVLAQLVSFAIYWQERGRLVLQSSGMRYAQRIADIVRLRVPECATRIRSILEYGGLPLPASVIVEALRAGRKEQKEAVHAR